MKNIDQLDLDMGGTNGWSLFRTWRPSILWRIWGTRKPQLNHPLLRNSSWPHESVPGFTMTSALKWPVLKALVYVGRRPSFSAPERGQAWKMPSMADTKPKIAIFIRKMKMNQDTNMGFWCFGEAWDWFWAVIFGNMLLFCFSFSGHAAYHNLCWAYSYMGWYLQIRTSEGLGGSRLLWAIPSLKFDT